MSAARSTVARAYWATAPGQGEIREAPLAAPAVGEVLVRMLWSGVSRGTESLVAAGRVPISQRQTMRCPFQEGDFPFPVKYGYAAVGRVEVGPEPLEGRVVFCLHPHQTAFIVPATAATPLPDGLPAERAVLAANLETALNAVWDAGILPGDRVVVLGAGVVGALVAWLAGRLPGTEVTLADVDPSRAALAQRLGLSFAAPEDAPREADIVVEASGSGTALAHGLGLAGFEATVLALGWYGEARPALPLGEAFHSRRLRIVSSQVGAVAAARRARWSHARRLAKVMDLLRDPALDAFFSGECRFDDLADVMPRILRSAAGVLCHRVRYD
jgi:threonine dehydrogenase-like Zn-dependent dehydrogenase